MPAQWSQAQAGAETATPASLAQWWQTFNDADLKQLVERALQRNTSVRSAQASLVQARAQRDAVRANAGPALAASGSARGTDRNGEPSSKTYQLGLDASWEPDVFGGNRAATAAAQADAQAALASLGDVQVSLAAEVALTYLEWRSVQARLAIAQNNLVLQADTLQLTRWRNQAGLASSLDVQQALGASEQTRAQLPTLQTSATQLRNSLAVLTGQAPGALPDGVRPEAALPQAPDGLALGFPADTLRQRPDVRSAEAQVRAAWARVAQADAARYPSFSLSGSLGLSALSLGTLTNGASVLRSLLAGVSWPVFDGGVAQAQVRAQTAAFDQARASFEASVLTGLQDVEDALTSLQGNRERLARLQAAAQAAGNAELLARQRYGSGLIDYAVVLEAQRSLLSTQDGVASTQADIATDHVRLYKALGGGWNPDADTELRGGWTPNATADSAPTPAI